MARQNRLLTWLAMWLCGAFLISPLESAWAGKPEPAVVPSSRSGVFVASSPDRDLRNQMLRAADSVFVEWKKILSENEGFAAPIILNDKTQTPTPRGGSTVRPLIFDTEVGMKVQVDIHDKAALQTGAFAKGVFTVLALQAMYGNGESHAGKALALPPGWFVEALAEELRRSKEGAPEGLYSALIQSGHPPDLDDFFRQKPEILDAGSIVSYRAQAVSLLQVLKKTKESKHGFAALLADPTFSKGEMIPILSAFPSVASQKALSKLWTLSIARGSMPSRMASLSVEQSDQELSGIFKPFNGPSKLSETAIGTGGGYLMRECAVRLFNLEFRAHPIYRPILDEYRKIVTLLARKPKARVAAQIEDVESVRNFLVQRSEKITDYLNWYEVTQIDALPAEKIKPPSSSGPLIRNDPYAIYLDGFEARGW